VRKATAAALAQQKPAAAPAAMPKMPPAIPAAAKASTAIPAEQAHMPPAARMKRAYLSAYAENFTLAAEEGAKLFLPVEAQRADGGMAMAEGILAVPEDGYHMLLWELGVGGAQGAATLQLGINEAASQLTYALHPGYDSGQQVTWLSAGDKVGLFLQNECGESKAEVQCTSAQFTVIRLG